MFSLDETSGHPVDCRSDGLQVTRNELEICGLSSSFLMA